MFLYKYLSDTIKTTALLVGLNGVSEKIDLKNACQHIDSKVSKIESYFNITPDADRIEALKNDVLRLSYNYEIDMELLQRKEALFEQQVILGFPNATLPLPVFPPDDGGIYHFIVNTQLDGFSCGWWTLANALAIENHLQQLKEGLPTLNASEINKNAVSNLQKLFQIYDPQTLTSEKKFLSPEEIDWLSRSIGLNKKKLKYVVEKNVASCIRTRSCWPIKNIRENKFHLIKILSQEISLCCLENNQDIAMEPEEFIIPTLWKIKDNFPEFEAQVLKKFIALSNDLLLNNEADGAEGLGLPIDLKYLTELIEDCDEFTQQKIRKIIVKYRYSSLINKYIIANTLKVEEGGLDITSKELTLLNLAWILQCSSNNLHLKNTDKIGKITRLVYLKSLSDYFEELKVNRHNGALYFSCYLPYHWFLISVINLREMKPIMIIMDSTNREINDPIKHQYVTLIYNLFIKGQADFLNRELEREFNKLNSPEEPSSDEEHLLQQAIMKSLLSLHQEQEGSLSSVWGNKNKKANKKSTTGFRKNKGNERGSGNSSPQPSHITLIKAIRRRGKGKRVDHTELSEEDKIKFLALGHTFCRGNGKEKGRMIQSPPPTRELRSDQQRSPSGGHIDKCEKKS